MEPTVLTSAALRAATGMASSVAGRYRPMVVSRIGSAEDRAQSYRRFLDATARATAHIASQDIQHTAPELAEEFSNTTRRSDLVAEVISALYDLRLCAPSVVLAPAEKILRRLVSDLLMEEERDPTSDETDAQRMAYYEAHNAFLDAARQDLAYHPRWWQWLRKRSEAKWRKAAAREAG